MRKIVCLIVLMFFVHFLIIGAFFSILDSFRPSGKSGNIMATALELIVTMISCLIVCIVVLIEKYEKINLKNIIFFLLYLHCLFHFYWEAFFEYKLFNDSKSFDNLSIIIILMYFVCELFFTFYVINKLYKSEEEE